LHSCPACALAVARAVENIFDIAFLVKDGDVNLTTGDDGEPMLNPTVSLPSAADYQKGLHKTQNIMRIDYCTYVELCKRYADALTGPQRLLKTRPPSTAQARAPRGRPAQA